MTPAGKGKKCTSGNHVAKKGSTVTITVGNYSHTSVYLAEYSFKAPDFSKKPTDPHLVSK